MTVMQLFILGVKNAQRRLSRTLLTMGMVAVSTSLLVLTLAWLNGVMDELIDDSVAIAGHVTVADAVYNKKKILQPLYANMSDVDAKIKSIQSQEGVTGVYGQIQSGATLTVGEEIGEVFTLVTAVPAAIHTEMWKVKMAEGRFYEAGKKEVIIGHKLKKELGAKLGDDVIFLGATQDGAMSSMRLKLVGIISDHLMFNKRAFIPLAQGQYFADMEANVTELLIYGEHFNDAVTVAETLRATGGIGEVEINAWQEISPWKEALPATNGFTAVIILIVLLLAALGIWNTFTMSILERRAEIGVMRAMGLTRFKTLLMIVLEASWMGLIGAAIGLLLGAIPTWYLNINGIEISDGIREGMEGMYAMPKAMRASLDMNNFTTSFVLAMVTAFSGAILPAWAASRIPPYVAMRQDK
jgi:putative ABC transport system permease protein